MNTEPLVSVVRGEPTEIELAALVTVLMAASSEVDASPAQPPVSHWARSARPSMRQSSWKASHLPR
ncbi:acyl-CoA carboxylase subunit epsilon [Actinoplanes sp. TRM 88003]|uniref:Acyl-CoA carboxylase subunit epsilon n=1 Tax=Paractinoplanes aksuensis TaxID=2939490 RepID=A0ABT1DNH1_9ACTN|nr:acyl-CoA carboxylase subunit epsilon [Actinoplanes aksuensis]MCO8272404.1 acyl-CoA carboxylase subunit epsilon [Actinoplanes aksuensis]